METSGEVTEKKSKSKERSNGTVAAWAKARKSSSLLMKHRASLKILTRAESYRQYYS